MFELHDTQMGQVRSQYIASIIDITHIFCSQYIARVVVVLSIFISQYIARRFNIVILFPELLIVIRHYIIACTDYVITSIIKLRVIIRGYIFF
jgi:hypothetical protein